MTTSFKGSADFEPVKYNIYIFVCFSGYGEQNPALAGRFTGNFPVSEGPTTPGPFPPGLTRNEGTIPGVGVAMPLSIPSLDPSAQGDQKHHPISMPLGAPPLPPGPHPSLMAANQQQSYQQNPQHIPQQHQQHHQALPQKMPPMPMPPNMQQLQPPSHLPLLPHPHLTRPPPQMPPHGMSSSIHGSLPMQSSVPPHSMPGPMVSFFMKKKNFSDYILKKRLFLNNTKFLYLVQL